VYENLLGYRYELKLNSTNIGEKDIRRTQIENITLTLRRNESSSLMIRFADNDMKWLKFFASKNAVSVYFKGMNVDGSAPEEFRGYAGDVSPTTSGKQHFLEVTFQDVPPSMTNSQKKARTFKNMTRSQLALKLGKEFGVKVWIEYTPYVTKREEEITLNVNDSYLSFLGSLFDEVGYRFTVYNLHSWIITPKISSKSPKFVHSNLGIDSSLLNFSPNFNRYSYEDLDNEKKPSTSGDKKNSAIDPKTKNTKSTGNDKKPTNGSSSSGGSSGSGGKSSGTKNRDMVYDPKTGRWHYI
jgi:uncharacterized membrane protein YgcG